MINGIQASLAPEGAHTPKLTRILDWAETRVAMLLLLLGAYWLLLMVVLAGPLWRDELCSVNLASATSLQDLWDHLEHDSCPILWPLILRTWLSLGMSGDSQIRIVAFLIGMCTLASLWLAARSLRPGATPILSASLLAFSPAFLFTVSSVRAYGLGSLMLVCTMGLTWRAVKRDTPVRVAWLAVGSMLAAHSLYTAAPFLFAILSGGILVLLWERKWKSAAWMMAIGCFTAVSMMIYRPVVARASTTIGLFQIPIDVPWIAVSMKRAVETAGPIHFWAWVLLPLIGIMVSAGAYKGLRSPHTQGDDARALLFSLVILLAAPAFYGVTLLRLKVPTQFWYYIPLMIVVAVAMDGLLGGRQYSPWLKICRLAVGVVLSASSVSAVWQEVHTRRTNIDIAAHALMANAGPEDLIILDPFYIVTSFERYYSGKTRWTTLPPMGDTRSGGYGSVKKAMMEKDPLRELLAGAEETFRNGNRVWIVGGVRLVDPDKLPPAPPVAPNGPFGWNQSPYTDYWTLRLGAFLRSHAEKIHVFPTDPGRPVNSFEDVHLLMFTPHPNLGQR